MDKMLSGRYRIIGAIGTGGMAVVYRAWDEQEKREVALKVLRPEFEADREFVRRFDHEAIAASKMSHENIVEMYGVGVEGERRYIVMEFVDGQTLKELIRKNKRIPPQMAVRYALRILAALDHAHKNNIIHRDIKPQNILVNKSGKIKVADFGIAKLVNEGTGTITDTNTALGSVHYVSPEQASGDAADMKSDLYSVGVVLYEMLTGCVPFDGETAVAVALKQVSEPPKSMRLIHRDISKGLDEVIMKALEKDPAQRYQTAAEMASDLKRALRMPGGGFVAGLYDDELYEVDEGDPSPVWRFLNRIGINAILISTACIAVLVFVAFATVKMSDVMYGVDIPNVTGYTRDVAEEMLGNYDLAVLLMEEYSTDVAKETVIRQEPEAGVRGRRSDEVTLYISAGTIPVELPDTESMTMSEAISLLSEYGFTRVSVEYVVDREKPVDEVLFQIPNNGVAQQGEVITLQVNSREIAVPELGGCTRQEAEAKLVEAGLKLGNVFTGYSMDDIPDTVVLQNPPANSYVFKGSGVDITIALENPVIYYANYAVYVPLTMSVRVELAAPDGTVRDVFSSDVEAGNHVSLDLTSKQKGEHIISVYFDGEINSQEAIDFQ
ncbi:MAG: protein kinase [Clostridia bacterium]|nr:protein kinase [Clostridia bacterium]